MGLPDFVFVHMQASHHYISALVIDGRLQDAVQHLNKEGTP